VATLRDNELNDALVCYEVARLTFRSLANAIALRLAAGKSPSNDDILAEEEARSAILAARRRVLAASTFGEPAAP
jgi:hypothetical protein